MIRTDISVYKTCPSVTTVVTVLEGLDKVIKRIEDVRLGVLVILGERMTR